MTKNIKAFAFIILLISTSPLFAQDELPIPPQNAISIVPQYAFVKGIRVDYEKNLKNTEHWIVVASQIYLDAGNNSFYYYNDGNYGDYQSMIGVGINFYYKSMVYTSDKVNWNSGLPRHSLYLQAGPNYQYFNLTNKEEVAIPFIDNGITYYQFDVVEVNKPINRFGAVGDVGWQLAFDRFLLDLYLGVAIKYSIDGNGKMIKDNHPTWVERTYSGVLLDGGVRVGMFF